jgi:hypothetical protein
MVEGRKAGGNRTNAICSGNGNAALASIFGIGKAEGANRQRKRAGERLAGEQIAGKTWRKKKTGDLVSQSARLNRF